MYIRRRFLKQFVETVQQTRSLAKKEEEWFVEKSEKFQGKSERKKAKSASAVRENHSLQQGKNSAFSDNTKAKAKEILCEKKKSQSAHVNVKIFVRKNQCKFREAKRAQEEARNL